MVFSISHMRGRLGHLRVLKAESGQWGYQTDLLLLDEREWDEQPPARRFCGLLRNFIHLGQQISLIWATNFIDVGQQFHDLGQ